MARQKKYKSGYLRKRFTVNGKQYEVYAVTAMQLMEKEIAKREEIEKGVQDRCNPTLYDYYKHFTDVRRRELKGSTLRGQNVQFRLMAGVIMTDGIKFGEMRMQDITRRDIETVRENLLQQGKKPEYLNICFAHLNHVFNTAVTDDTVLKNPCKALKQLKRETPPVRETTHRALTLEETRVFFKTAEDRHSYYLNGFLLMIKTGMRVGEIAALYPTDIDRKNGFIHVRRTITRDEIGNYCIGDSTKTFSGKRDIPLTTELLNIISDQQSLNRMFFGIDRERLFRSAEGGILKEYSINREIKRICKAAGIEKFTNHAFRNTFATRFIEQRPQDYKILSEILGHSDVSISLNIYTHVMTKNKVVAMNEIRVETG